MSVKRLKYSLILISLLFSFAQINHAAKNEVRIGVLSIWGDKITKRMWQPTIRYLNKAIPKHQFTLSPLKLAQATKQVEQGTIDFILTNPGNYINLEARFGISRLATLKIKNKIMSQASLQPLFSHEKIVMIFNH